MVDKSLEQLTRDQLWKELRVRNRPVGGSKEELKERLTRCLKEEGLDPATEFFEVKDARLTVHPLMQILEKLSATEHHLTNVAAKANQHHSQCREGAIAISLWWLIISANGAKHIQYQP